MSGDYSALSSKRDFSETMVEPGSDSTPTPDALREQAARCRRLTSSVLDRRTFDALTSMADEYEAEAQRLARAR